MNDAEKSELTSRLDIIERQLRGIQAMVLKGRSATEILSQLKSAHHGLAQAQGILLGFVIGHRLESVTGGDAEAKAACMRAIEALARRYGTGCHHQRKGT